MQEKMNEMVDKLKDEILNFDISRLSLSMRTINKDLSDLELSQKIQIDEQFERFFRVRKMTRQTEMNERMKEIELKQDSTLRKMHPGPTDEAREERRKIAAELSKTQTKFEKIGKMDAQSAKFAMDLALADEDDLDSIIEVENKRKELKAREAAETARLAEEQKAAREIRKAELQNLEREETISKVKNMTVEQMKNIPIEELLRLKNIVKNL